MYISIPLTLLLKFQAKNVRHTPPYLYVRIYIYLFITTSGYLYDNAGCTRESGPPKYKQISQLLWNRSLLEDDR